MWLYSVNNIFFLRQKKFFKRVKPHHRLRTLKIIKNVPRLHLGDAGFFYIIGFRFDLIYLKLLRRLIKRAIKPAKKDAIFRKVWLNLITNYPLSKKAKNARMGKGKGKFVRWAIRIYPGKFICEFQGFPQQALHGIIKRCDYFFTTSPILKFTQAPTLSWGQPQGKLWETAHYATQLWV